VGRSFQFAIDRIYLFRLFDENGNAGVTNTYRYNRYRNNVTRGDYNESTAINTSGLPSVNLSVNANAGTEATQTQITLNAIASSAVSGNQSVNINVSGTNIDENDYTLSATSMTISNNNTQSNDIVFTIQNDAQEEGNETAIITLTNPSSGLILGTVKAQSIIITDDDSNGGVITSVSDVEKEVILIYPNPTEDKIKIENLPLGKSTFILSDATGNEIITSKAEESFELDLSNFPTGVYTLKLNTSKGNFTKKVVKK